VIITPSALWATIKIRFLLHKRAYKLGVFLQDIGFIGNGQLIADQPATQFIKIGARVVRHTRAITFQLAKVAVSGDLSNHILGTIQWLPAPPVFAWLLPQKT